MLPDDGAVDDGAEDELVALVVPEPAGAEPESDEAPLLVDGGVAAVELVFLLRLSVA